MSESPESVALQTSDLAAQRRAALAEILPGLIADGAIDAVRLGEALGVEVTGTVESPERYGLMWHGKADAIRSLLRPGRGALVPNVDRSIDFDTAEHTFVEGDNLEVLKLLQKAYNDRVKMIYIDPPYNTGSSEFIYKDDYRDGLKSYLSYTGQLDDEGNRNSARADTAGRMHSAWLSMMYPRLALARNLLTQDGVIFVSIDDHEVHNLRLLMDEVFGAENFVASVIWQKAYAPKNSARHFSEDHDYVLVYARNADEWHPGLLPRTAAQDSAYKNLDADPRGLWRADNLSARNYYSRGTYSITSPSGRVVAGPPSGSYWRVSEEKFWELDQDNRIWWGTKGDGIPALKRFMSEVKQGRVPQTFWPYSEVGHNQDAKKQLLNRVTFATSDSVFDTPKPTQLIQRMLQLATTADTNDIVLDFFAGSGSTGDAVLQVNAADGGNRRFVLVQLPEETGAADYSVVSDITRTRLAAAIAGTDPTVGLRDLSLTGSSFAEAGDIALEDADQPALLRADATLEDAATDEGIAAEVLIKEGVPLHEAWIWHIFGEARVVVAGGVAVCLGRRASSELVAATLALSPKVVVFLEDSFTNRDVVKAEAFYACKQAGITMRTV